MVKDDFPALSLLKTLGWEIISTLLEARWNILVLVYCLCEDVLLMVYSVQGILSVKKIFEGMILHFFETKFSTFDSTLLAWVVLGIGHQHAAPDIKLSLAGKTGIDIGYVPWVWLQNMGKNHSNSSA